jgi:hypothetical protein
MEFMVSRYGDFVRYRPPLKGSTLLLWFGPGLLFVDLACGAGALPAPARPGDQDTPLTAEEQRRAEALLQDRIQARDNHDHFHHRRGAAARRRHCHSVAAALASPGALATADRREANLAIFRDQLAELEREREDGSLADEPISCRPGTSCSVACSTKSKPLPGGGTAGHSAGQPQDRPGPARRRAAGRRRRLSLLGNPRALDPLQRQARIAPEQIEGMVNRPGREAQEEP